MIFWKSDHESNQNYYLSSFCVRDEISTAPSTQMGETGMWNYLGIIKCNGSNFVCSWLCHQLAMCHWANHFFLNSNFSICQWKELDQTISEIPSDMEKSVFFFF